MFTNDIVINVRVVVSRTGGDTAVVSRYVNEAMAELINRRDFCNGTMESGATFEFSADHGEVCVKTEFTRLLPKRAG